MRSHSFFFLLPSLYLPLSRPGAVAGRLANRLGFPLRVHRQFRGIPCSPPVLHRSGERNQCLRRVASLRQVLVDRRDADPAFARSRHGDLRQSQRKVLSLERTSSLVVLNLPLAIMEAADHVQPATRLFSEGDNRSRDVGGEW